MRARAYSSCARLSVRPVTRRPRSAAAYSAKPPQPQPISRTCSPGATPGGPRGRRTWRAARPPGSARPRRRARGVGHGGVEPEGVEVVAEVVVPGDVAPRLSPRVAPKPVARPLPGLREARPREAVVGVVGLPEPVHERQQVRRVPAPVEVGLGEAHLPLAHEAGEDVRVAHDDLGHVARRGALRAEPPPVGQDDVEAPARRAGGRREDGREVPGQAACPSVRVRTMRPPTPSSRSRPRRRRRAPPPWPSP
jgi:hypothetical protein